MSPQSGDPLFTEPLDGEVNKDLKFYFEVTFDQPGVVGTEPALKTMQDISNLVRDIVDRLGRFLP